MSVVAIVLMVHLATVTAALFVARVLNILFFQREAASLLTAFKCPRTRHALEEEVSKTRAATDDGKVIVHHDDDSRDKLGKVLCSARRS